MTQWYPKPAVYDHEGWHPMPYLDQGEFYSEFGSFDVYINVPANYVVGATGDLPEGSPEYDFLARREALTRKRIALRCEKTRRNFSSFVALAAAFALIKSVHTA